MKRTDLVSRIRIGGFAFDLEVQHNWYSCRGEVMYDDEHDQMPEPALWDAAEKLEQKLERQGLKGVIVTHSEKGWVEVQFDKLEEDE